MLGSWPSRREGFQKQPAKEISRIDKENPSRRWRSEFIVWCLTFANISIRPRSSATNKTYPLVRCVFPPICGSSDLGPKIPPLLTSRAKMPVGADLPPVIHTHGKEGWVTWRIIIFLFKSIIDRRHPPSSCLSASRRRHQLLLSTCSCRTRDHLPASQRTNWFRSPELTGG